MTVVLQKTLSWLRAVLPSKPRFFKLLAATATICITLTAMPVEQQAQAQTVSSKTGDDRLETKVEQLTQRLVEATETLRQLDLEIRTTTRRVESFEAQLYAIEKELEKAKEVHRNYFVETYMGTTTDPLQANVLANDLTKAERRKVVANEILQAGKNKVDSLTKTRSDTAVRYDAALVRQENKKEEAATTTAEIERLTKELADAQTELDARIEAYRQLAVALEQEQLAVLELLANTDITVTADTTLLSMLWPTPGPLTSGYGMRWGALHAGVDIGAPTGTPIWAAADGTVLFSGVQGGYGKFTLVDHGQGVVTAYGHQSVLLVAAGQQVKAGDILGLVGSTGDSTGPHLHFEVRVGGTTIDPLIVLRTR